MRLWPSYWYFGEVKRVRFKQVSALEHVRFRQVPLYLGKSVLLCETRREKGRLLYCPMKVSLPCNLNSWPKLSHLKLVNILAFPSLNGKYLSKICPIEFWQQLLFFRQEYVSYQGRTGFYSPDAIKHEMFVPGSYSWWSENVGFPMG